MRAFVKQAAISGIDVFRVFDSLNWVENMRVAIDAVLETGKLCEAAICYTGNLSSPNETKYTLDYYLKMGRELKAAGTHILGIKDMAGLCQPNAAYTLVKALKDELEHARALPHARHLRHRRGERAGGGGRRRCDAVDGAIDAMSGFTSQPNLGSIVEALRYSPRDTGIDPAQPARHLACTGSRCARTTSRSRATCAPAPPRCTCTACPAGNTPISRSRRARVGLDDSRWPEVSQAYADVNQMFGNIVKVTPSSKVVGDLALMMVSSGITKEQVLDPNVEVAFPESVVQMMRGDLGRPEGGWPEGIQKKVLKDAEAADGRPGRRRCRRSISPAERKKLDGEVRPRGHRHAVRVLSHVSRRCSSTTRETAPRTATAPSCRRRCSSTAWSRATRSASTSNAARR